MWGCVGSCTLFEGKPVVLNRDFWVGNFRCLIRSLYLMVVILALLLLPFPSFPRSPFPILSLSCSCIISVVSEMGPWYAAFVERHKPACIWGEQRDRGVSQRRWEAGPHGGCCYSVAFQQVSRAGRQTDPSTRQRWQAVCSGGLGALKLSFQDGVLTRPLQVLVLGLTPGFSGFAWPFRRAGLWKLSYTGFNSSLNASASWIHPLGSHFAAWGQRIPYLLLFLGSGAPACLGGSLGQFLSLISWKEKGWSCYGASLDAHHHQKSTWAVPLVLILLSWAVSAWGLLVVGRLPVTDWHQMITESEGSVTIHVGWLWGGNSGILVLEPVNLHFVQGVI